MSFPGIIGKKIHRPNLTAAAYGYIGNLCVSYQSTFSPNGNFIAVPATVAATSKQLSIWSWNGIDTVAEVESINVGSTVYNTAWHPSGNYLAVAVGSATGSIRVYSWNGTDTLTEVESIDVTTAEYVDWHPNGNYLAAATDDPTELRIYSWNGTDTLTEVESVNIGSYGFCAKWSNDGNYLATTSYDVTKSLIIYSWNGTDTLTEVASYDVGNYGNGVVWTLDNKYLFIFNGNTTNAILTMYFDGSSLTLKDTRTEAAGASAGDIYYDRYIAAPIGKDIKLYKFNKTTEVLTEVSSITFSSSAGTMRAKFNSKGTYLTIGIYEEANITFRVVKVYG